MGTANLVSELQRGRDGTSAIATGSVNTAQAHWRGSPKRLEPAWVATRRAGRLAVFGNTPGITGVHRQDYSQAPRFGNRAQRARLSVRVYFDYGAGEPPIHEEVPHGASKLRRPPIDPRPARVG